MNRFRKPLLFLSDSALFLCAVGFYLIAVRYMPYTIVGGGNLTMDLPLLYGCIALSQLLFKTYDSLWRYAESKEYLTLIAAALVGFGLYEFLARMLRWSTMSFVLLSAIAAVWVLEMLSVRFLYRVNRSRGFRRKEDGAVPVVIIGAGGAGERLLDELRSNPNSRYAVQSFFDDDPGKRGKQLHGVPIRGPISAALPRIKAMGVHEVIVAIPSLSEVQRKNILEQVSDKSVHISILPDTLDLISGKPIRTQLREVRIEDLLGRDVVDLDNAAINTLIAGKTVLVTGGGGSIGSELCRQIAKRDPKQLVIVDIYENNAYDIQQELKFRYGSRLDLRVEIASIRDAERMDQLFRTYRPEVVFHAAAHKHVPLMETSPQEAIRNNVFGTLNLVRAADAHGVKKFIQISTDKAVNPTSVMGASKRLCEMIVQSMAMCSETTFAAVRFGNVLGSNGSVIPLFKRQIENGGPVTITDKRIIRYFMTIPEAAQLVLEAGSMAKQNELFVLDMGQPVKILDLAENLVRLSGYEPYRDIDIIETGLRPGEKLYEELLIASRDIEKTENEKIFVEHQPVVTPEELAEKLEILRAALEKDPSVIRSALHRVVPTFREPEELNNAQGERVEIPPQQSAGCAQ